MTVRPPVSATPGSPRAGLAIRYALAASVLAHLLLLAIPLRERLPAAALSGVAGPLIVQLAAAPQEPLPQPEPPSPEPEASRPAPAKRPTRPPPVAPPLAMPPREVPVPPETAVPVPEPSRDPPFDMSALIAMNRERRLAREAAAARGSPSPGGAPRDAAAESLSRNLASLSRGDDTGGVFRILRVGARTAEFSFHGWTTESRRNWREVIEVDAGPGGDVERAIVQRMIALIRGHYPGDFNWESQRLGRVVVLSAAPENNAALEDYLMREFFGTPLVKRGS